LNVLLEGLSGDEVESDEMIMENEEKEEKDNKTQESNRVEMQSPRTESNVAREAKSVQRESEQPGREDANGEEPEVHDQTGQSQERKRDWTPRRVSRSDYTTWNIVLGIDKESGQAYAMAESPKDGDVAILERVSNLERPEYQMRWHRSATNRRGYVTRTSRHLPGLDWDEWMCKRGDYVIKENLGQALNEMCMMREETDMKYLELRDRQKSTANKRRKDAPPAKRRRTG
jgi:hypothetical protein